MVNLDVAGTFAAIVVAAGSGQRFGGPKHELELGGVPLWLRCRNALSAAGVSEIVVVGDVPGGVPGGARRRDSVRSGLSALSGDPDWVLVHDAARPLLTTALIESIIAAASRGDVDAVVPGTPLTDTVKRIDGDVVRHTVDRAHLIAVQTPQAFRTASLLAAHDANPDDEATDDAALIERHGGTVVWVEGDRRNIKITYPGDLDIAEALLEEVGS